ncbi:hypothetical protein [Agrobacterium deltaense]|uniref:hypothetical protein n=1 Tax=Agrobacterium deltaense TaxID=1183412 RepID=UPI0013AF0886|nr:hypothetical protein [Agrobacterium deltaense]
MASIDCEKSIYEAAVSRFQLMEALLRLFIGYFAPDVQVTYFSSFVIELLHTLGTF